MQLLDAYLQSELDLNCISNNVPDDGSCMYHAVLESFEQKYGYQLEINHKGLRKSVATYLLQNKNNQLFLEQFREDEPGYTQGVTNLIPLKERYVAYCNNHMHQTTDWPEELCIHAISKIYGFQIIVYAEQMTLDGIPSGFIIERLKTTPDNANEMSIMIGNRWNQHFYSIGSFCVFNIESC